MQGRSESLQERTLGVHIFGKDPSYDTTADPIVRVTAAEIRKRIAQYYHDPRHQSELCIDIESGSYVPRFRASASAAAAEVTEAN